MGLGYERRCRVAREACLTRRVSRPLLSYWPKSKRSVNGERKRALIWMMLY
ncbi:conserved hypothetical protein [Ricinus communis]|uniref:Uncharacterized protein n=1 Tax=Ricinus communis TaxID=3988 RepID=B9SYF2_RICCO|nr:conserved hypothetical protein [Ricinus communis]